MAGLNDVPVTGQTLAASRDLINQNFSVIDTAFSVNHVQYNDASGDQGKHASVEFIQSSAAPSFLVNEIGLFCQNYATTSQSELWLTRGTGTPFPVSAKVINSFTAGWTNLISGARVVWGRSTLVGGTLTIMYAATIPTFPGFGTYSVPFICRYNASGTADNNIVYVSTYNTNQMTVQSALSNATFLWFAIGV